MTFRLFFYLGSILVHLGRKVFKIVNRLEFGKKQVYVMNRTNLQICHVHCVWCFSFFGFGQILREIETVFLLNYVDTLQCIEEINNNRINTKYRQMVLQSFLEHLPLFLEE